MHLIKARFKT